MFPPYFYKNGLMKGAKVLKYIKTSSK